MNFCPAISNFHDKSSFTDITTVGTLVDLFEEEGSKQMDTDLDNGLFVWACGFISSFSWLESWGAGFVLTGVLSI